MPLLLRLPRRGSCRAFRVSLLLSLLLHAGAAWLLVGRPARVGMVLQLQSGEQALDLDLGAPVAAAPAPPRPDIPEARAAEAPPLEPDAPEKPDDALPPDAAARLRGTIDLYDDRPEPPERLTPDPARRYHRRAPREEQPSAAQAASPALAAGADARPRGVIQRARPMGGLVPDYPEEARRHDWEGEVLVRASIDSDGACLAALVERSSGYPALDAAALDTVRRARFVPASEDGNPVAMEERFIIDFQLR